MIRECECAEEGTRNVVAECLGKLTLIDPAVLLPKLKEHLQTPSPLIRATVVTAVKFTISEQVSCLADANLDHWSSLHSLKIRSHNMCVCECSFIYDGVDVHHFP